MPEKTEIKEEKKAPEKPALEMQLAKELSKMGGNDWSGLSKIPVYTDLQVDQTLSEIERLSLEKNPLQRKQGELRLLQRVYADSTYAIGRVAIGDQYKPGKERYSMCTAYGESKLEETFGKI